jgi:hypothetical protein
VAKGMMKDHEILVELQHVVRRLKKVHLGSDEDNDDEE